MKHPEEDAISHIFKLLCCLPYLPADKIKEGFDYIRKLAESAKNLTTSEQNKLDDFIAYVKREWINGVGPEDLSVYDRPVTATSGLESVNRSCNRLIETKHPDFYKFLCKLW